jgi:GNAT superfamily N-acetyltransferase
MTNSFINLAEYSLVAGTVNDRALVLSFLETTYRELYPTQSDFGHLENTIERYFSLDTPVWFVSHRANADRYIACLWLGIALDQITGNRHPNIFLIYVDPAHRRQGIGRVLLERSETWGREQNYTHISLQVFTTNEPALTLYQQLGYRSHSLSMMKAL